MATLEAEDVAVSFNVNIQKEKDRHESQNQRQSRRDVYAETVLAQLDKGAWLEGQKAQASRNEKTDQLSKPGRLSCLLGRWPFLLMAYLRRPSVT